MCAGIAAVTTLQMSPVIRTLSKALSTSKKRPSVALFFPNQWVMLSVGRKNECVVQ